VSDAGHIVAEASAAAVAVAARTATGVISAAVVPVTMEMMVMMIGVMPAPIVGPIGIVPIPGITPIGIRIPGIAPIGIPAPIGPPVGTIAPAHVNARVVVPIEWVVAVHIDIGGAAIAARGVIIVIIVSCRRGLRAETLDARGKVGIVIGFGGGVHHAVGVGHRLSSLVNGIGIVDVVFAVGIVGLVVVFRVAADAWAHVRAVACGHLFARVAVRRIIGVVFGCLAM